MLLHVSSPGPGQHFLHFVAIMSLHIRLNESLKDIREKGNVELEIVREKGLSGTIARNYKGIHISSTLKTQLKKRKGLMWWSINKFLILGDPI